jgi:hypothetical protein
VRGKDPDRIEGSLALGKKLQAAASAAIGQAGDESGRLMGGFEALLAANRKVIDAVLHGENVAANQYFIEESNPAFSQII